MAKNLRVLTIEPPDLRAFVVNGSRMDRVVINGTEYWRKASDIITLTASGQPSYYNSGQGDSGTFGNWHSATYTVPAGYSRINITAFTAAGCYGQTQTQLLLDGTTVKTTGTRYDYNTVTSWVGDTITVSEGQVLTFRCRGGRDQNRDSQGSDISASLGFYFE